MIDISFEINGKKVSPNNIGNAIEAAIYQSIAQHVKDRLESVKCIEHNEHPKVTLKGKDLDHLEASITGCCQPLVDHALDQLK